MAHIELRDVGIRYFDRKRNPIDVLKGVHLDINEGEFVSVIGHSGCGKSTMLNMVAGFAKPTWGSVTVNELDVSAPGPDRMMVFQNHSLLPWLTVRENVMMAANTVHKSMSKRERAEMVEHHLLMVGLGQAADKRPNEISGGMKQRAGIARGLITQPNVLLMDEPFGALDALTRGKLQEKLLEIWEEHRITVMLITHDVDEAILLSDRVVMMSNGPEANIAEILDVEIPRPRNRMEAVNHPSYYQYRNHLVRFLNANKHRSADAVEEKDPEQINLGFIPLTDCAPLLMAEELGIFEAHGLNVKLHREPSWRSVSKGIMSGRLQASMMLAPTPFFHNMNPETTDETRFTSSMVLSRNGDAITLTSSLKKIGVHDRETLRIWVQQQPPNRRPKMAMVFPSSMHNLLLRKWLKDGGIEPDRDVELIVIPPPQMLANLELGNIIGYCVGEPWNSLAVQKGIGFIAATSNEIMENHAEKVLGFLQNWVDQNPDKARALTAAIIEACDYCQNLENRDQIIETLVNRKGINVPATGYEFTLRDKIDCGEGVQSAPNFHLFHSKDGIMLKDSEAQWILDQMSEAGLCPDNPSQRDLIKDAFHIPLNAKAAQTAKVRSVSQTTDGTSSNVEEVCA